MTRIAVIADPHIGVEKPNFVANWRRAVEYVNEQAPILTVILGDLTFDGANCEADCAFAREALSALRSPWLAVPGNHDIGDTDRASRQAIDDDRIARWRRHFGRDHWLSDAVPGWRLVGANSQLFGTGLPREDEQWAFLHEAAATERRLILFTHFPLFMARWDEPDMPYWAITQPSRRRLREMLARPSAATIVSGHVHRALMVLSKPGPAIVWAPATSFLTRDASMPPQAGTPMTGVTMLDLSGGSLSVGFHARLDLEIFHIEDFNGSLYPAPAR